MNHMIPNYKFRLKASSTFNYILFLNKIPNCVTRSVIDVHFKQQAFLKKKLRKVSRVICKHSGTELFFQSNGNNHKSLDYPMIMKEERKIESILHHAKILAENRK